MPCVRPLTHGGAPPSKRKSDSQAMPPARAAGESERLVEQGAQLVVAARRWNSPFARPKVPSHCTWIPCPG